MVRWREAMAAALYGPGGFFTRPDAGPAGHFRTSAHASPLFAGTILRLLVAVDQALGRPDPLDLVDIGAGRGELLAALLATAPPGLRARLRPVAVEPAPPADPGVLEWRDRPPAPVRGLVLATEWLDNVPVDVAELDTGGTARYLLVDPASGREVPGGPVTGPDADWLSRWWPLDAPGTRAEIGLPRDQEWAGALATVERGVALAVDYGHLAGGRPPLGTLTGFRDGREVRPVPDGSCDLTAHVAMDSVAAAGGGGAVLFGQREALRALGMDGTRPPLALASTDPVGYLRRLAVAGAAAELTDPDGLGGHTWLLQPVGLDRDLGPDMARWLI
jgi:SAM-dependent MidA family methyltransferase